MLKCKHTLWLFSLTLTKTVMFFFKVIFKNKHITKDIYNMPHSIICHIWSTFLSHWFFDSSSLMETWKCKILLKGVIFFFPSLQVRPSYQRQGKWDFLTRQVKQKFKNLFKSLTKVENTHSHGLDPCSDII